MKLFKKKENPDNIRDVIDELQEEHDQVLLSLNNDKARLKEVEKDLAAAIKAKLEMESELIEAVSQKDSAIAASDKESEIVADNLASAKFELSSIVSMVQEEGQKLSATQTEAKKAVELKEKEIAHLDSKSEQKKVELQKLITLIAEAVEKEKEKKQTAVALSKQISDDKKTITAQEDLLVQINKTASQVEARIVEDAKLSIKRVEEAESLVEKAKVELERLNKELKNFEKETKDMEAELKKLAKQKADQEGAVQKVKDLEVEARKHHQHIISKEEHLRNSFDEIGMVYPEFKQ